MDYSGGAFCWISGKYDVLQLVFFFVCHAPLCSLFLDLKLNVNLIDTGILVSHCMLRSIWHDLHVNSGRMLTGFFAYCNL